MRGALAAACAGAGGAFVVEGPAGIGKTRLLSEVRAVAEHEGMHVLSARGGELERDFGFGIVRQLLERVLARADPAERDELLSGAAQLAEAVFTYSERAETFSADTTHAVLHGLYWLTANLAERSPLLLAIDDVHWADAPSQRFLLHLCHRLDSLPILVVMTLRAGDTGVDSELLHALTVQTRPRVIRLRGLSETAIGELVERRLGESAGARLRESLLELTGGNPFLVDEAIYELASEGKPLRELDPATIRRMGSDRIATAILLRVSRLDPAAPTLAQAIAVLGDGATIERAAALAGVDRATTSAMLDLLVSARVLEPGDRLQFVHPIVRTAIYGAMSHAERGAAHARAARQLAEEGAEPGTIAVHLLAADPAGSDRVVATLRSAAAGALAQGAPETAARYLRRALAEPPSAEVNPEVLHELGSAAARAGSADGLALIREAFVLSERQPLRAAAGLKLGVALTWQGADLEEAISVFEHALVDLDDPDLAASLEAMLLLTGITSPAARRLTDDRHRAARAKVAGMPAHVAKMLTGPIAGDVLLSDCDAGAAARVAQQALAEGTLLKLEVGTDMPLASAAMYALAFSGQSREAEQVLDDAIMLAQTRGSSMVLARVSAMRSFVRYLLGDLAKAEADARSCLELHAEAVRGIPGPLATAVLVAVLLERNDPGGAWEALRSLEAVEYNPEATPIQPLRMSRANALVAEGNLLGALEELRLCARWEEEWPGGRRVVPVAWRSAAAIVNQRLGDQAAARELAAEEVELARQFGDPRAIGVALRAHGIVEGGQLGLELLRESESVLADSASRLEHARALIELGGMLRRRGGRATAAEKLRLGMQKAHECGAVGLVRSAQDELRLAGVRPTRITSDGQDALTPAERRVADLAGEGMRNKEIAQTLFVTLRTVEMHLSSAYRKLHISSREQLPDALTKS